jgi:hypothetical protein
VVGYRHNPKQHQCHPTWPATLALTSQLPYRYATLPSSRVQAYIGADHARDRHVRCTTTLPENACIVVIELRCDCQDMRSAPCPPVAALPVRASYRRDRRSYSPAIRRDCVMCDRLITGVLWPYARSNACIGTGISSAWEAHPKAQAVQVCPFWSGSCHVTGTERLLITAVIGKPRAVVLVRKKKKKKMKKKCRRRPK